MDSIAKKTLLEFASFSTPRAITTNLSLAISALAILPTELIAKNPAKCIFKEVILPAVFSGNCPVSGIFSGCNCPACGITRGLSRILHLDFGGALKLNPLAFPVFAIMLSLIAINVGQLRNGRKARAAKPLARFQKDPS
ncbi:MAG: DUF2752 domain-containing protein [archaeon]